MTDVAKCGDVWLYKYGESIKDFDPSNVPANVNLVVDGEYDSSEW